jgi:hypothetical protein
MGEGPDDRDWRAILERDLDDREPAILGRPPHLLDPHLALEGVTWDGVGEEGGVFVRHIDRLIRLINRYQHGIHVDLNRDCVNTRRLTRVLTWRR